MQHTILNDCLLPPQQNKISYVNIAIRPNLYSDIVNKRRLKPCIYVFFYSHALIRSMIQRSRKTIVILDLNGRHLWTLENHTNLPLEEEKSRKCGNRKKALDIVVSLHYRFISLMEIRKALMEHLVFSCFW